MALSKKEKHLIAVVAIIGAIVIIYWLLTSTSAPAETTGDGQQPDTNYLTFNQPPPNAGNYTGGSVSGGSNTYGGISLNNSTGCCGCSGNEFNTTPSQNAAALGDTGASNIANYLASLPPYYNIAINGSTLGGSNIGNYPAVMLE